MLSSALWMGKTVLAGPPAAVSSSSMSLLMTPFNLGERTSILLDKCELKEVRRKPNFKGWLSLIIRSELMYGLGLPPRSDTLFCELASAVIPFMPCNVLDPKVFKKAELPRKPPSLD